MTSTWRAMLLVLITTAIMLSVSACATLTANVSAQPATPTLAPTWTPLAAHVTITTGSGWIPLRSTSPADLIAAARDTLPMTFQGGDSFDITATTPAGTPALVYALRNSEFPHPSDYGVVPFLTGTGAIDVTIELNATHTAFRSAGTSAGGSRPHGIIWQFSESQAVSALRSQRHTALAAGFQPILVYWTVNFIDIETGAITWSAGPIGPTHPAWLLRGANSVYYILADDGHVYALSEMPLHTLPPVEY